MKNNKSGLTILAAAAAGAAALASYIFVLRPRHLRWGATDDELDESLPGDAIVPLPEQQATHAITINAPVADVWPWLVQVGQTRGGFYSYTWLENLVGCNMRNADRVVPEWQSLRAGDVVWLHPKAPPLPVAIVEPYRAIVLGGAVDDLEAESSANASAGTWGLYIKEVDENISRLLVRIRSARKPGLLNWISNYVVFEPAHFIMERKMMLGIKQRAESLFAQRRQQADVTDAKHPLASAKAGG